MDNTEGAKVPMSDEDLIRLLRDIEQGYLPKTPVIDYVEIRLKWATEVQKGLAAHMVSSAGPTEEDLQRDAEAAKWRRLRAVLEADLPYWLRATGVDDVERVVSKINALTAEVNSRVHPRIADVVAELHRAVAKFPEWPIDPLHAAAIVGEEAGEFTRAVLQCMYEPDKAEPDDVRTEACQTAAMCIRFLLAMDDGHYTWIRARQMQQKGIGHG